MTNLQTQNYAQSKPMPLSAVDLQRVAPQNSAVNPGAVGRGVASAGVPLSPTVSAIVGMQQTLVNTGLIDEQTQRDARCVRIEEAPMEEMDARSSDDNPSIDDEQATMLNNTMTTRSLLQSLNNKKDERIGPSQELAVDNSTDTNGLPSGTYATLKFAMSVISSVLMQVNATVGQNSAKISELNTAMGVSAEQMLQTQLDEQKVNLEKQEQTKGIGSIFGRIGHVAAYMAAAAMIIAACVTLDPALLAAGIIVLALTNSYVSSHTTEALAAGLSQIPGISPEVANILAETIILVSTIAVCVVTANVAGVGAEAATAEAEVEEVASSVDEAIESGSEALGSTGGILDTTGGVDVDMLRLQSQIESGEVQATEKSLSETLSEGLAQMKTFMMDLGKSPAAYNFVKAVGVTSAIFQGAAGAGQAVSEGKMATLTENYAELQANMVMLQGILDSVSMRNQEVVKNMKSVTQANYREIGQMYNSVAQGYSAVAQAMYHV